MHKIAEVDVVGAQDGAEIHCRACRWPGTALYGPNRRKRQLVLPATLRTAHSSFDSRSGSAGVGLRQRGEVKIEGA